MATNQSQGSRARRLATREDDMRQISHGAAASLLLEARRSRVWLPCLPEDCRPRDLDDAYAIQQAVLAAVGPVAAWKVGAGSPDAVPACAAIAPATLFESGASLPARMFHLIGIEAEIAFRLAADLPPRDKPYSRDEVVGAIGSVHAAIEISDTRFVAWASQDRPSHVADQLNHGALVIGSGRDDWKGFDAEAQRTILSINGRLFADVVGGNPAGDPLRLMHWLANHATSRLGGLRAGAIVTTGSVAGVEFARSPVRAEAVLPGIGSVHVTVGQPS